MQDELPGGSWGFDANDGIYAWTLPIQPGFPVSTVSIEIDVKDASGGEAFTWPYLVVE